MTMMMMVRLASPTFFPTSHWQLQQHCLRCHMNSSRTKHDKHCQQLQLDDDNNHKDDMKKKKTTKKLERRAAVFGTVTAFLMLQNQCRNASGLNIGFDQMINSGASSPTLEDALSGIKGHAQSLLEVKGLFQEESWMEAQRVLRKTSSNLKIDLSSIIESKPPALRRRLRSLFNTLFNIVNKLDYAAREQDVAAVSKLYEKMAVAVEEVLSAV